MAKEICGICVRRREHGMHLEDSGGECLRPFHTDGLHLFLNARGEYIAWKDDDECDCCVPGDPDQCFDYGVVSKEEAEKLLEERP